MDKCCGNCKLWEKSDHALTPGDGQIGSCIWFREYTRGGGKLPECCEWQAGDDDPCVMDFEGRWCQTWQKKEG